MLAWHRNDVRMADKVRKPQAMRRHGAVMLGKSLSKEGVGSSFLLPAIIRDSHLGYLQHITDKIVLEAKVSHRNSHAMSHCDRELCVYRLHKQIVGSLDVHSLTRSMVVTRGEDEEQRYCGASETVDVKV